MLLSVFVGVGAHVGVDDAVGAAGHDPCWVVVTAEAIEGDARAYKSDELAKKVHGCGEVLGGFGWTEG